MPEEVTLTSIAARAGKSIRPSSGRVQAGARRESSRRQGKGRAHRDSLDGVQQTDEPFAQVASAHSTGIRCHRLYDSASLPPKSSAAGRPLANARLSSTVAAAFIASASPSHFFALL